jgi:hypothetical protein
VLVLAAVGLLAWRAGLLDPVLARLDLERLDSRAGPDGWQFFEERASRGPAGFFPIGRGLDRRGFGPWLRFGRFPIVGALALLGALTLLGGLAALAFLALRALFRPRLPPPPSPAAPPPPAGAPPASA